MSSDVLRVLAAESWLAIVQEGGVVADMVREISSRPEFAALPDLPERIASLVRELAAHGMLVPMKD